MANAQSNQGARWMDATASPTTERDQALRLRFGPRHLPCSHCARCCARLKIFVNRAAYATRPRRGREESCRLMAARGNSLSPSYPSVPPLRKQNFANRNPRMLRNRIDSDIDPWRRRRRARGGGTEVRAITCWMLPKS
jgi:hypothetical protein